MKQTNVEKYDGELKPNTVNFSENYNGKLNCHYFTTIRSVSKANYFLLRIGEMFEVTLRHQPFCKVLLKDANVIALDKISPELMLIDTGTSRYSDLLAKFNIVEQCVLCLFERIG